MGEATLQACSNHSVVVLPLLELPALEASKAKQQVNPSPAARALQLAIAPLGWQAERCLLFTWASLQAALAEVSTKYSKAEVVAALRKQRLKLQKQDGVPALVDRSRWTASDADGALLAETWQPGMDTPFFIQHRRLGLPWDALFRG